RTHERIVQFVESETPPGSYIVTDLWWFDQVTAGLYPTRVTLFVDNAQNAQRAAELLRAARNVFVVRSDMESPPDALQEWQDGALFPIGRRASIPERSLTLTELSTARRGAERVGDRSM